MRSKPLTVANPKTDKQLAQRSAMKQSVEIFQWISGAIRIGFRQQAVKKSEYNAFTSEVTKNAFTIAPPLATFVPADMLVSKGSIPATDIDSAVGDQTSFTATIDWDGDADYPGQSANDQAIMVLYNEDKETWAFNASAAVRSDESWTFSLPDGSVSGDTVRAYLGFYGPVNRRDSNSVNTSFVVAA